MELPIGLDSITIIPGTLAQRAFGLQPTLHRVLYRNDDEYIEKDAIIDDRSEEHTSELQSLMRISYAVFCLKKKTKKVVTRYQYSTTNIKHIHIHIQHECK